MTNIPCFPDFHGHHNIISPTHYHFHYKKNPEDNELCQTQLHHLITELHEKQFTTIGLTRTLNRFVAQKANRFSINHYGHAIARYMDDDENTNLQQSDKFFIK